MTDSEKPDSRGTAAMLERIRNRRAALGLNGSDLARRAGISPSYVSLIERGHKVPNEDVAARLALALEDDADLYRAWARGERVGYERLEALQRLGELTSDARTSRILASGRDLPPMAGAPASPPGALIGARPLFAKAREIVAPEALARAAARGARAHGEADEAPADDDRVFAQEPAYEADEEPSEPVPDLVLEVPVLAVGADPRRMLDAASLAPLHLDARLVGPGYSGGLFAYELDRAAATRFGEPGAEGAYVVLTRRVRRLGSGRVYAVRADDDGIRLGRVLFKGNSLLVVPPAGSSDVEVVHLQEGESWRDRVVGLVVLTLKRWR